MAAGLGVVVRAHAMAQRGIEAPSAVFQQPRLLLEFMDGDQLAQVLSFSSMGCRHTVSAVSPSARVLSEMLVDFLSPPCVTVSLAGDRVRHLVSYEGACPTATRTVELAWWWLERCGLPLWTRGAEALSSVLAGPASLRAMLQVVHLTAEGQGGGVAAPLTSRPASAPGDVGGSCGAAGAGEPHREDCLSLFQRACALPGLVQLSISGLQQSDFDVALLACAAHLASLQIDGCTAATLTGFEHCHTLTDLSITDCTELSSLAPLADAPQLQRIVAVASGVSSIAGLSLCPQLRKVDFSDCRSLTSLAPLAAAPQLRHIVAAYSGVSSIDGLGLCEELESVDFTDCEDLTTLVPLAGAPQLMTIKAANSGVLSIDGLNRCPCLERVDFSDCPGLTSLAPLAGAPRLRLVDAAQSGVRTIDGLGTCPELAFVDFCECEELEDLSPLAGASRLISINASWSAVAHLQGLSACIMLETVRFEGCENLEDLSPLRGAPSLESVTTPEGATLTGADLVQWMSSQ